MLGFHLALSLIKSLKAAVYSDLQSSSDDLRKAHIHLLIDSEKLADFQLSLKQDGYNFFLMKALFTVKAVTSISNRSHSPILEDFHVRAAMALSNSEGV